MFPNFTLRLSRALTLGILCLTTVGVRSQTPPAPQAPLILTVAGRVEFLPASSNQWQPARTNQVMRPGDRLRTGERSRATVRLTDLSVQRVPETTTFEIESPRQPGGKPALRLNSGSTYLNSRANAGEIQFRTPVVSGAIRGTELLVTVGEDGRTVVALLDGAVDVENERGRLTLVSGEQAVVEPGGAPGKTALLEGRGVLQWCLYYPGVVAVNELGLSAAEQQTLAASLEAYRSGDVLGALAAYPEGRVAGSDGEKAYRAALLLAVGQAEQAQTQLSGVNTPLAEALRGVMAAVQFREWNRTSEPVLASEWLAESYYRQSRSELEAALAAAKAATDRAPDFGYAWARVAELEFSFGRVDAAQLALGRGLELSPRNAQAQALKGFLLSARSRWTEALEAFETALALDGSLGNAWLGRGLVRIRRGDLAAGRADLHVAATLEPGRSVLRSYLGKAFQEEGESGRAEKELRLAKELDAGDPTPWLYRALALQQGNRINEAVRELERSVELNDNRSVYRSGLLLDQDRAVRSANLASIYRDAGMTDVSVREASRAVTYDYANYSAHLFLASSYDALRDPKLINLRYETAGFSEYVIANLLAPPNAGSLSRTISQQEYAKLFERDRLGLVSSTEYLDNGDWIQDAAHYGVFGNTSYALEASYRTENGSRPNNDLERLVLSAQFKQQLTPKDSVYIQAIYYEGEAGDLAQYYDQSGASQGLRTKESQEPIVIAGMHHEWSPNSHTLLLAGRFVDEFSVANPANPVLFLGRDALNQVVLIARPSVPATQQQYESDSEIYSVELQQIWQVENHGVVLGGRYQTGAFDSRSDLSASTGVTLGTESITAPGIYSTPALAQSLETDMQRLSVYGYYNWRVIEPLVVTAGVAYDWLEFPVNHRVAPLSAQDDENDQVSPKAGFIWDFGGGATLRGSYTRSLGGVSYDQSVRLEPSQVAGFNQAYRSLIPESVAGSAPNALFETWGGRFDYKFESRTYVGVAAELLESEVDRIIGSFDLSVVGLPPFPPAAASSTLQEMDYEEKTVAVTLNQLIGNHWSVGARYRWSQAKLHARFPEIPTTVTRAADTTEKSILHQLDLFALVNLPCGFFARGGALWSQQSNQGYSPNLPGDDFWQFNVWAGYRFRNRVAELSVGCLNLTDQDYQLAPLNLYAELPRERTLTMNFKFNF